LNTCEVAVGSVVILKSGGPKMTVCRDMSKREAGIVECVWFSATGCESGMFPSEALGVVEEDDET
jgi:uncharacterized protein YodC (DUF2158 family)